MLRFAGGLQAFLKAELRGDFLVYEFTDPPSLKHVIEACGVPHTEVGAPEDLRRLLRDGDKITVAPAAQPEVVFDPRFVLDCHLGRLAKYLRLLGFDTWYENHAADEALAALSQAERRTLLTMDRGLLMRRNVERGFFIWDHAPRAQLQAVLRRYELRPHFRPLTRCLRCNRELEPVAAERVWERIPPKTKQWCREFYRCPGCDRVYWKGSHYERMVEFVSGLPKI
jgi:hypothetical protein